MCCKKTLEVLEKIYWSVLDGLLYVILTILFILTIVGIWGVTMFDKYFMKFLEAVDNFFDKIWNWIKAPKCKCNLKNKKVSKEDLFNGE